MNLHCPNCGALITAENINIQKTLAVCSQCNHVFDFEDNVAGGKTKRRKVRQPARLHVREDERDLTMWYNRVYDETGRVLGIVFPIIGFVMLMALGGILTTEPNIEWFPVIIMSFFSFGFLYLSALVHFNTTHVRTDGHDVEIKTGPLPFFGNHRRFSLGDARRIITEETEESKKSGNFDRFYHVNVELEDGSRRTLLKGMPEEYAFYMAQVLNATLSDEEYTDNLDTSRLTDDETGTTLQDMLDEDGAVSGSQNSL